MTSDDQHDQDQPDGTIAGAVAKRDQRSAVEVRLDRNVPWLDVIAPSHMSAAQLVALSVDQFRKIPDLHTAAEANFGSFMSAVAECARLGLVPGDTFYYVPFQDRTQRGGWAVTGMIDWKGEIELIHRANPDIETVVCQEVRGGDIFRWVPSAMRIPEHEIPADDAGQVGLSGADDRGPLTGAYCYVRYRDGGTSYPTVMHASEIRKHFEDAKSRKFWGEWPAADKYPAEYYGGRDGKQRLRCWTPEMFRKTAVHKHADSVPTSAEYLQSVLAAATRFAQAVPADVQEAGRRTTEALNREPAPAQPEPEDRPNPRTIAGAVEQSRPGGKRSRSDNIATINKIMIDNRLDDDAGDGMREARCLIVGAAAAEPGQDPVELRSVAQLNAAQAETAAKVLAGAVRDLTDAGADVREGLLTVARDRGWQPAPEVPADA